MIFDRKLYREVIWSHDISLGLHNIYIFIHFFHWWIPRCRENQKRLGLFLCLWKLQKRFLHAKQTVSLVLCSFILASPLYCFLTFIKSRPFSLYREAFRLEPTLVISRETQWREIFVDQFTGIPVHQSTSLPVLDSQLTFKPLHHYTTIRLHHSRLTSHHSLLIAALGLIEFSIQWLWSIATNPSLELTFKCGFDTIFQKKNHSATGSPVYYFTSYHSRLTTHY